MWLTEVYERTLNEAAIFHLVSVFICLVQLREFRISVKMKFMQITLYVQRRADKLLVKYHAYQSDHLCVIGKHFTETFLLVSFRIGSTQFVIGCGWM